MPEPDYANRELDEKFKILDTLIRDKHDDVMIKIGELNVKVSYTNGKVRKIIMAMLLLGGIVIGQTLSNTEIIQLLFHLI